MEKVPEKTMIDKGFFFYEKDWLYQKHKRIPSVVSTKYLGFKTAMMAYMQIGKCRGSIVETGTQRVIDDGGGSFTLLFAEIATQYKLDFHTVDISPVNLEVSKKATEGLNVSHHCMDSVRYLRGIQGEIGFLFLDSMDCDPTGDSTGPQEHQLAEFMAAEDKLTYNAVLLMDDNSYPSGGKTRILKNYILDYRPEWTILSDEAQTYS